MLPRPYRQGALLALALLLAACARPAPQHPLTPAAQRAAADKLMDAFVHACLQARDSDAAVKALKARGWPRFNTVWHDMRGAFYAAPPAPGLFVISDRRTNGLICVGHYMAPGPEAMIEAAERRWGPGHAESRIIPGARAWTFHLRGGVLTPSPAGEGASGPAAAAALAGIDRDEALVYGEVSYNAAFKDVASLVSIRRP